MGSSVSKAFISSGAPNHIRDGCVIVAVTVGAIAINVISDVERTDRRQTREDKEIDGAEKIHDELNVCVGGKGGGARTHVYKSIYKSLYACIRVCG